MLFKSQVFTQASGSVDGLTYSHNKGGNYVRMRKTPVNPNTTKQNQVRVAMSLLAAYWRQNLTTAQRNGWDEYAANTPLTNKLGDQVTRTGLNMFLRGNVFRVYASETPVFDAPSEFGLPGLNPVTISVTSGSPASVSMTYDDTQDWVNQDGAFIALFLSRQQSVSINFFKGPYQLALLERGSSTTAPTSPASGMSQFATAVGSMVFGKAILYDELGRRSTPQFISSFVSA